MSKQRMRSCDPHEWSEADAHNGPDVTASITSTFINPEEDALGWSDLSVAIQYHIFKHLRVSLSSQECAARTLGLTQYETDDILHKINLRSIYPLSVEDVQQYCLENGELGSSPTVTDLLNRFMGYMQFASSYEDITETELLKGKLFLQRQNLDTGILDPAEDGSAQTLCPTPLTEVSSPITEKVKDTREAPGPSESFATVDLTIRNPDSLNDGGVHGVAMHLHHKPAMFTSHFEDPNFPSATKSHLSRQDPSKMSMEALFLMYGPHWLFSKAIEGTLVPGLKSEPYPASETLHASGRLQSLRTSSINEVSLQCIFELYNRALVNGTWYDEEYRSAYWIYYERVAALILDYLPHLTRREVQTSTTCDTFPPEATRIDTCRSTLYTNQLALVGADFRAAMENNEIRLPRVLVGQYSEPGIGRDVDLLESLLPGCLNGVRRISESLKPDTLMALQEEATDGPCKSVTPFPPTPSPSDTPSKAQFIVSSPSGDDKLPQYHTPKRPAWSPLSDLSIQTIRGAEAGQTSKDNELTTLGEDVSKSSLAAKCNNVRKHIPEEIQPNTILPVQLPNVASGLEATSANVNDAEIWPPLASESCLYAPPSESVPMSAVPTSNEMCTNVPIFEQLHDVPSRNTKKTTKRGRPPIKQQTVSDVLQSTVLIPKIKKPRRKRGPYKKTRDRIAREEALRIIASSAMDGIASYPVSEPVKQEDAVAGTMQPPSSVWQPRVVQDGGVFQPERDRNASCQNIPFQSGQSQSALPTQPSIAQQQVFPEPIRLP